jgi:hypothetical protein
MSDPTPAARHAKVVEELKRRLEMCEAQDISIDFRDIGFPDEDDILALESQRTERPAERAVVKQEV